MAPGAKYNEAVYRQYVKDNLSEKRYFHTCKVVEMADKLAGHHGVDRLACRVAAWLHDCKKEAPLADLLHLCRDFAIINSTLFRHNRSILHGPAASAFAQEAFGITDKAVLDAMYYHTTGRPNMTKVEMVVFLADMVGEDRSFAGVEAIRALSFSSLKCGTAAALNRSLVYLLKRDEPIYEGTVTAYNHYIKYVPKESS